MKRLIVLAAICAALLPLAALATASGEWLEKVPAAERVRPNPIAGDPAAPIAGERLFQRSCASCHGADAMGRGSRPSLRTARVQNATDGELQWLLKNGELARGMPSWSRLPEAERWQLVRYLHTLGTTPVTK